MRDLNELNDYRERSTFMLERFGTMGDETCGAFNVPHPATGTKLRVIAAAGEGWDHVSVSLLNRCPNWPEMDFIKRKFFHPNEVVMQLHVGEEDHINVHPYVLHLWRPHLDAIPLPPKAFV
jgi:hypothetical protein